MKLHLLGRLAGFTLAFTFLAATADSQWGSPNAYGYSTGYGVVYGTFNQAALVQSMYNVARCAELNCSGRGQPAKQVPNNRAPQAKTPTAPVVRNYGLFRPDPSVDTGKLISETLGSSPEEKALIKQIYAATKESYEKEAAAKGWKNNIAGALTFFTTAAATIYHDSPEPETAGVDAFYKTVNESIDSIPDFGSIPNKDKQHFNNMMIGFGGMLLAIYTEGKQNDHAETVAASRKLAGVLIELVLKADPEKIRIENGRIVLK